MGREGIGYRVFQTRKIAWPEAPRAYLPVSVLIIAASVATDWRPNSNWLEQIEMSWPHNQKAPQLSPSFDSAFPRIGCLLSQPTSVSVRDGHPGSRLLFFPLTAEEGVHVPRTAPAQVPGPALRSAAVSLPTLHQALCAACTLSLEPASW